jgi:predicted lipoprotein with Yx(FWY)xxD motif
MSNSLPTGLSAAVRLGVPLAAALLAVACSSSTSTNPSANTNPNNGGYGASASATPSSAAISGMVISTKSNSAGTYLTDGSGRSVYLWDKDSMNKSYCTGACTSHWSPVPAPGKVTVSGGAKASDLGSIIRSDGSKQVTYDGHPLYYYIGDTGPGQTNGQGLDDFGAQWWLVTPSGTRFTVSPSPAKSSSGGGGYGGGY